MCFITINGIAGHEDAPGQGITKITVLGTATQCGEVEVKVTQTQPLNAFLPGRQAPVDSQGNWEVEYSVQQGDFTAGTFICGRGNKYVVEAVCVSDSSCDTQFGGDLIVCGDCPVLAASFSGQSVGDICDSSGQRDVGITLTVMLGSSGPATIQMELLPASAPNGASLVGPTSSVNASNTTIPALGPWVVSLSPGDYIVRSRFLNSNCPPRDFNLSVPACPVVVCPEITWSAEIDPQCNANGRREVIVVATIMHPGQTITATLRDFQSQSLATGSQADDLTLTSSPLLLGGGDHDFSIQFSSPVPDSCQPDRQHTVSVPACPGGSTCPTVAWSSNVSKECTNGRRQVSVTATVQSFGTPLTAQLLGPQNQILDTATTTANGSQILDSGTLPLSPGSRQFRVVITAGLPQGCAPELSNSVIVPDCSSGGGGGGSESFGCFILRIVGLSLLIGGLVAIFGGGCSGNPIAIGAGVASAVLGAALLILWAALCAPKAGCRQFQRLIALIDVLILVFALAALIFGILSALGMPAGGCAASAIGNAGYLGVVRLILWQMFLSQRCEWQGDSSIS